MIDIPDALIATRSKYNGEAARAFLVALPGLADRFLGEWGLRPDGAALYGMCALVLPVVRASDGRRAALKLQAADEETLREPVARQLLGRGQREAGGRGGCLRCSHDSYRYCCRCPCHPFHGP